MSYVFFLEIIEGQLFLKHFAVQCCLFSNVLCWYLLYFSLLFYSTEFSSQSTQMLLPIKMESERPIILKEELLLLLFGTFMRFVNIDSTTIMQHMYATYNCPCRSDLTEVSILQRCLLTEIRLYNLSVIDIEGV